jgi:hypothetical protein
MLMVALSKKDMAFVSLLIAHVEASVDQTSGITEYFFISRILLMGNLMKVAGLHIGKGPGRTLLQFRCLRQSGACQIAVGTDL